MPDNRKYSDRAEYLKRAVAKRRIKIKKMVVDYKGGKCVLCGYDTCPEALDLHHKIASEKTFGISAGGLSRSWERVKDEADKCVLLCANCHRELHASIRQPVWETKQ
ncbi:HNH endonuclease [Candidatus Saccharibacteria bacterium]|nr:HNH endonuclease [Candidatus Saccharibacteria bacterium]